jgi:hypothetical protein
MIGRKRKVACAKTKMVRGSTFSAAQAPQDVCGVPTLPAAPYMPIATATGVGVVNVDGRDSDLSHHTELTSMNGPGGTRGRDARTLNRGKNMSISSVCKFHVLLIYQLFERPN